MARFVIGLLVLVVAVGILAALVAPGYVFYTGAGHNRDVVTSATNRSENTAKSKFDIATMDLEQQRIRGLINDSQYARGYANELAVLHYRESIAKNPVSGICQSELQNKQGGVREYPLPAACGAGLEFTIWPDGPEKIIKAELLSADGDPLGVEPNLVKGRGSQAEPLSDHRWKVEGNVSYRHEVSGKNRILRITVE